jgi:hypothetical protein
MGSFSIRCRHRADRDGAAPDDSAVTSPRWGRVAGPVELEDRR